MKLVFAMAILSSFVAPAFAEAHINRDSKVFIEPMPEGFNTYLRAALIKKHVPLVMVGDEATADYVIVDCGNR
jgi:hypothetical protein